MSSRIEAGGEEGEFGISKRHAGGPLKFGHFEVGRASLPAMPQSHQDVVDRVIYNCESWLMGRAGPALTGKLKLGSSLAHRFPRGCRTPLWPQRGLMHPDFLPRGPLGGSSSADPEVYFQAPNRPNPQRPRASHGTEKKHPLCFQQMFSPEACHPQ